MGTEFIRVAQIETNTQCNYACWFCPNKYFPQMRKEVMEMELFARILREMRAMYTTEELNLTAFSAYNEPTLDPLLLDRLRMLTDMGYAHLFVANASNLRKETVDAIVEERLNICEFILNLPTVDKSEAESVIGVPSRFLGKVLKRVYYLIERMQDVGIPIRIVVNGTGSEGHRKRYVEVYRRFGRHKVLEIRMSQLVNRAGLLETVIEGRVDRGAGKDLRCRMQRFKHLYFGVRGNLYPCCHDFNQSYSFGNIGESPLVALIEGKKRKRVIEEFKRNRCRYCSESEIVI